MRSLVVMMAGLALACGSPVVRPDAGGTGGGLTAIVGGGSSTAGGASAGGTAGGASAGGAAGGDTAGGSAGGAAAGGAATAGGASAGGASAGGSAGTATLTVSSDPRRGPIAVDVAVSGTDAGWDLRVRFDGGTTPATLMRGSVRDGGHGQLTWQSFDDVPFDGVATLEVVSGSSVIGSAPVTLRNDPGATRIVAVGHPLFETDAGSVTNLHDEVSLGRWDGATLQDLRRVRVGVGPDSLNAAPHGRALVVVNDRSGTLSVITTPLDGNVANATVLHNQVTLPSGNVIHARFSHDGRSLYVVGSAVPGTSDYRLWRFVPTEDLSSLGTAMQVAELPGPSLRFDVERDTGRLAFPLGPGLQNRPERVFVVDPADGLRSHVSPVTTGGAAGFAVSPKGGLVLSTDEFLNPGMSLISLGQTASMLITRTTSILDPADVVFHPDATPTRAVALVSQPVRNRVTPVVVTPSGIMLGTAVSNVPLGSSSDIFERGPSKGVVLIACVTDVYRVTLDAVAGSAGNRMLVTDFGANATDQVKGVAIQR